MALVVGLSDIKPEYVNRPGTSKPGFPGAVSTTFFRASADTPDAPTAALNRYPSGETRYSAAHFHAVDQFQVIMEGKGTFGRHAVSPYCVHFSRAYTPYGPLQSDKETGWAFIVMRTHHDPGSQRMPAANDMLKKIPNRRPWQVTTRVKFPALNQDVSLQDVPEIKDDRGLFACTLTMAPHTQTTAPDPSRGDGQYVVVVKGSLMHDNTERQAPVVVFIKRDEGAFKIRAGTQGLEAIIMNFPRTAPRRTDVKVPSNAAGLKKWQCELCSFMYDEALGVPEEGIPAGTHWVDVPATWSCPDCSASKSDFRMVEA